MAVVHQCLAVAFLISIAAAAGCDSHGSAKKGQGGGGANESAAARAADFAAVDLSAVGNARLEEMQGLPAGEQRLGDIEFQIGPKFLQLGGRENWERAREVRGIGIGRTFRKLHLLQAAHGGGFQQPGHSKHEEDGVEIGRYIVHYESGRQEMIPLVYGENVRDWWNWDSTRATPGAKVVWTGENAAALKFNVSLRLFLQTWQNPHPDDRVSAIDFVSAGAKAAPVCIAMTLEGASPADANATKVAGSQGRLPPANVGTTPAVPQALPPDLVEERKRQAEMVEQQRRRAEWFAQVGELKKQREQAAYPLVDGLSNRLIELGQQASATRDSAAQSRLAEERNRFVEDPARLPRSLEARDAALEYAKKRIADEQQFLRGFQEFQADVPSAASDEERRVLADEVAAAEEVIKKLTASQTEVAALPRTTPRVTDVAGKTTAEQTPMPPSGTSPMPMATDDSTQPTKKEFLGPPPAHWLVTADPPREAVRFPEKLPYKVLENVSASTVLYPPGQTAFLGAAKEGVDVEAYKLYDLRSGQVIGQASDFSVRAEQGSLEGPALSADGTYLAVPNSFEKQILVGDVRQRKGVAKLACDFFAPAVLFPTPTQLLALDISSTKRAILWELPSGKKQRSFELADEPATEAGKALTSPGGKYLAIVARQGGAESEVQFYDLGSGTLAGALRVNERNGMKPRFNAIGFSADGSEFAAFVHGVMNGQNAAEAMVVWDLASGRPVYQRFIEDGRRGGQGLGMLNTANRSEPLQWFPDGKGWLLFQRYVVDREAAAVIEVVEGPGEGLYSAYGTKILDNRRVLIADHDQKFRVIEVKRTK